MRVLLFVMASSALGCVHRSPANVHVDPTGTPPEPTTTCTMRRTQSGETVPADVYVRPVAPEYRYDARGRLLFAVDQTEYANVRRSWFFYDARDRLVHVHRRVDRVELPSSVFRPICDDGPCPPFSKNDQDGIDEDYRYDESDRLVVAVERFTRYDHHSGALGETFRPFYIGTRTATLRFQHAVEALPTSARFSVLERWNRDGGGPWQERRPLEDQTIEYAYDIGPRVVTQFQVRDGVRAPDLRVERDEGGRSLHETRFSDGDIWQEVSHRRDDAGRRVETVRTDRAPPRGSTERLVTTSAYDPLGRLTEARTTRASDGWTLASTYEYGAGCNIPGVFEEPLAAMGPIDPLEHALARFLARP